MLDAQAAMLAEKLFEGRSLVRGRIVEQGDDRAAEMAQQLASESTDFLLPDVVVEEQVVQAQTMPPWADGDSRDNRNLVPPSLTVMMDGRVALRSPDSDHVGISRKPDSSAKTIWAPSPEAFFLCVANPLVSSVRSCLHPAPAHAVPASVQSTPSRASGGRYPAGTPALIGVVAWIARGPRYPLPSEFTRRC
jgi:hypothetical protein